MLGIGGDPEPGSRVLNKAQPACKDQMESLICSLIQIRSTFTSCLSRALRIICHHAKTVSKKSSMLRFDH